MTPNLPICTVDFETRSFLDVRDVGAWRYAEDWTTEIMCMSWKMGDDESKIWVPPYLDFPQEVIDHVEAGGTFEAHNVQFERAIWMFILRPQFNVSMPTKWRDTLATCAYRGLPLGLDDVGKALDLDIKKGERGKYLLNTLSKPKFGTKKEPNRIYREDWDLLDELYEYCMRDTDSEKGLANTVGELPGPEYRMWVLDQKINQRGVRLDMSAVEKALDLTTEITDKLNGELCNITGGAVQKATQRDKLLAWFNANGLEAISDLKKETIEEWTLRDKHGEYIYKDHMPEDTLRALVIRSQLAKASTRKLEKMRDCVGRDGRVRGLLQYHGAGTGRWAGRLVQPQNFPRASITNKENAKGKKYLDMEFLIEQIMNDDLGGYDKPMEAVASSLRGMFISDPGKVFHVCDFSAIEARVTFWVANCQTGLDVFAKSDAGLCEDIYCVTASDLVHFEVKKSEHSHERQLGKITVLGCFEADTLVLTKRGWVGIVDITLKDKLWDGEEWVSHEGLLYQGKQRTIRLAGIGVTPDHMMMTHEGWVPASVVANEKKLYQKSALAWASSRLPDTKWVRAEVLPESLSSALADLKAKFTSLISVLAAPRAVIPVPKKPRRFGLEQMRAMVTSCRMILSGTCGRPDTQACLAGVTISTTQHTGTTEDEGLKYANAGTTGGYFSSTFKKSRIGISRLLKLIESTTTETMSQVTSAWQLARNRYSTADCRSVYDLLNVGPRHRFFVRSAYGGPVFCVSNCGYQMGWEKLQYQAMKDYGVVLTDAEAQDMVNLYRDKYQEVKWLWYGLQDAAIATVKTGKSHSYNNITYELIDDAAGRWLACLLPNGRRIWYYEPIVERIVPPWGGAKRDSLTYMGRDNKKGGSWGRVRTYGGMLCENVVQAIARDLMCEAMIRVEIAGYKIILTVHDEIISEDDEDFGSQEEFERIMAISPPWSRGCPIAVEGGEITRYQKV